MNQLHRTILSLALVAACTLPAQAASTLPPTIQVAPADEYFGRQKISALGIDNMIRDTDTRESFDPALASRLYNGLSMAEDALQDWARKYPHDSWIPKRAYLLSHLFWRMHSAEADAAADRCRQVLFTYFPKNRYAQLAHHETSASVAPQAAQATAAQPLASPGIR